MSEMKPVARVDGRWSDGRAMVRTLEAGANMPYSTELYTSEQLAEAVAAEREKNATYLNAFWAASSLDGEEVVVTIKLRALFIMDEKVKDTIRRVLNGSATK